MKNEKKEWLLMAKSIKDKDNHMIDDLYIRKDEIVSSSFNQTLNTINLLLNNMTNIYLMPDERITSIVDFFEFAREYKELHIVLEKQTKGRKK